MDATNGAVLASKNPHLRLPMASTTKIMTALLALKLGHLSDRITVPKAAFDYERDATVMGLHPGQVVTLRDLLYGLMLPSGADAANTIAIHYGGSEARFVALMNQEAARLGLTDTHFVNATGLTAANHYTSAYDLAVLAQYVSYLPDLMKITATRSYSWNGHVLQNINHALFWYRGVDGIKPGYTDDAGICQVLDAQRNGRHVVVALLRTPDLVVDARNLLNFGLLDFTWEQSDVSGDTPTLRLTGADGSGPYSYFVGSGHYVRGKLWTGYLASGGFATLGFPRTEALSEGSVQVQYFENGALSLDGTTGRVSRLALGLTPLPTPTATPSPSPTPTATATATPTPTRSEGTITPGGRENLPDVATRTPAPKPHATTTPPPPPGVLPNPTPTPTPQPAPSTAKVFAAFQRTHSSLLGRAASRPSWRHGYEVQIFAYGALLYEPKARTIDLLPLGDRTLGARGYLADHPGDAYPAGFAPVPILKAIGWPPFGTR